MSNTRQAKNPDPFRCVCRFDTDGTTVCGVHGDYGITYYTEKEPS